MLGLTRHRSPDQFQRKLEIPLRVVAAIRSRRDTTRVGIVIAGHANRRIRIAKVDVVEQVNRLDAELDGLRAADRESLEQRGIGPPIARSAQAVSRQVSEGPWARPGECAARRYNGS